MSSLGSMHAQSQICAQMSFRCVSETVHRIQHQHAEAPGLMAEVWGRAGLLKRKSLAIEHLQPRTSRRPCSTSIHVYSSIHSTFPGLPPLADASLCWKIYVRLIWARLFEKQKSPLCSGVPFARYHSRAQFAFIMDLVHCISCMDSHPHCMQCTLLQTKCAVSCVFE